jgi:sec-independent protein translocase protein TatB
MIEMVLSPTIAPTIQMASIGIPDTMFLMVLALIVFGPRRLPEIGRQIGKLMYEFRKVSNEFKFQMEEELRASEEAARQEKLKAAAVTTPEMLPAPVQFTAGTDTVAMTETDGAMVRTDSVEAAHAGTPAAEPDLSVPGEVRGEARKFPPTIQPPTTGEVVPGARPYRSWNEPVGNGPIGMADAAAGVAAARETNSVHETVTESGDAPVTAGNMPVVVADEGRIGTEVQPGVDPARSQGTEREANHA